ncbi:MAG: AI-2E family transporter [Actinomycetota bacterium]|nr:AI-2E family transporter [Actinomycetota bacterium]
MDATIQRFGGHVVENDEISEAEQDAAISHAEQVAPSLIQVTFSHSNVWRIGFVIMGVLALGLLFAFILEDGGNVIFTVLMSWFAAIAMAPVVDRLSLHMRRGLATIIVMLGFMAAVVLFIVTFGALLIDQLSQFVDRLPDLIDGVLAWVNKTFSQSITREDILNSFNIDTNDITSIATKLGVNALGFLSSVVGSVFGVFSFALFTFYLSADMPRLKRWVCQLFPTRYQGIVENVWSLTAEKTGNYVGARVVLATINSVTSGIVFAVIGLPYWLPLALWTGIVAQFVPTIGTYIAIVLPVIVGLASDNPWDGVIVLVWALIYQQVENLTFEPKISARAVNVNPAVAFGSVILGASLFGVAGAFLAVPVTAMMLSLLSIYGNRYELSSVVTTTTVEESTS